MPNAKNEGLDEKILKNLSLLGCALIKYPLTVGVRRLWKIKQEECPNTLFDQIAQLKGELTERKPVKTDRFEHFLITLGKYINDFLGNYRYFGEIKNKQKFKQNIEIAIDSIHDFKNLRRPTIVDRKICFPSKNENLYLALSKPDEKFIVSNGFLMDAFPYFDFWLENERDKKWIVKAYAYEVMELANSQEIDFICLIIKRYGGKGPIGLYKEVKNLLNKEIFYYNQPTKYEELCFNLELSKIKGKNIAVLYDLGLTLEGIEEAVSIIKKAQGNFLGAVVFHNYRKFNKENAKKTIGLKLYKPKLRIISRKYKFNNIYWNELLDATSGNFPYLNDKTRQIVKGLGIFVGSIASLTNPIRTFEVADKIEHIVAGQSLIDRLK